MLGVLFNCYKQHCVHMLNANANFDGQEYSWKNIFYGNVPINHRKKGHCDQHSIATAVGVLSSLAVTDIA